MVKVIKRAKRASEIEPELLAALNCGQLATATYVEMTAVDFSKLLRCIASDVPETVLEELKNSASITTRMALVGNWLAQNRGEQGLASLVDHPSDTARGWACYLIAALEGLSLARRLTLIEPLADDRHFGVREWAWIALRPHIAGDIEASISSLKPWTSAADNFRRFAAESTRPRGFWSKHIALLKNRPELGLPLLEPLRADRARYVQLSVGNWLNDAFKSKPEWVEELCERWSNLKGTEPLIIKRALRNRGQEPLNLQILM